MCSQCLSPLMLWVRISARAKGRSGRDRMVVGFTTTYAISAYHHLRCELESWSGRDVQPFYVIKFVSGWRQVGSFLRVIRFPPPIKLKYCWKWRQTPSNKHIINIIHVIVSMSRILNILCIKFKIRAVSITILMTRLFVRVCILLACRKHLNDCMISIAGEFFVYKTSLRPSFVFIKVPV